MYEKSLQHLACQAVLLNKFLSTLERSGNRLGRFYHRKVSDDPNVCLETKNYILTVREKKILLSDTDWLNDNIIDALKADR